MLSLLLGLPCPMIVPFERVPFRLQFSSKNFEETSVANWEMVRFVFRKHDPSQSMVNSGQLSFLKKTDSVCRMLFIKWSELQNRILPRAGLCRRLVTEENCRKENHSRKTVRFAVICLKKVMNTLFHLVILQ